MKNYRFILIALLMISCIEMQAMKPVDVKVEDPTGKAKDKGTAEEDKAAKDKDTAAKEQAAKDKTAQQPGTKDQAPVKGQGETLSSGDSSEHGASFNFSDATNSRGDSAPVDVEKSSSENLFEDQSASSKFEQGKEQKPVDIKDDSSQSNKEEKVSDALSSDSILTKAWNYISDALSSFKSFILKEDPIKEQLNQIKNDPHSSESVKKNIDIILKEIEDFDALKSSNNDNDMQQAYEHIKKSIKDLKQTGKDYERPDWLEDDLQQKREQLADSAVQNANHVLSSFASDLGRSGVSPKQQKALQEKRDSVSQDLVKSLEILQDQGFNVDVAMESIKDAKLKESVKKGLESKSLQPAA